MSPKSDAPEKYSVFDLFGDFRLATRWIILYINWFVGKTKRRRVQEREREWRGGIGELSCVGRERKRDRERERARQR